MAKKTYSNAMKTLVSGLSSQEKATSGQTVMLCGSDGTPEGKVPLSTSAVIDAETGGALDEILGGLVTKDELMQATGYYYDKTYKTMYVGEVLSSAGQTLYRKVLDGFNSPVVVDGNSKIAYFVIGEETYCLLNSTGNTFVPSVVNTKNYTVVSSPIAVLSKNKTFEYGGQSWVWSGSAYAPENTIAILKVNAELAFSPAFIYASLGQEVNEPTLSNEYGVTLTWSSSDTGVATVNSSGEVTTVGDGTATITASFAGNDYINADSASYSINVSSVTNNVITYQASAKLAETTSDKSQGLHTTAFSGSNGTLTITSHTFEDGTGGIVFSDTVTGINKNAFYGCSGMTQIVIPSSVTTICSNGSYSTPGSFEACSGLTSIILPSELTTIGERAFMSCTSLASITSLATTAPTLSGTSIFSNTKSDGTLYVPSGSIGYDVWMGNTNGYLGYLNWTKVEQ